jgi:hypothetical protein
MKNNQTFQITNLKSTLLIAENLQTKIELEVDDIMFKEGK